MRLRAGDWVEVRSRDEILGTLDRQGRLEGLPFMPQMFQYCGQKARVYKRAHKTCDTVTRTGGRRLSNAVHLEARCDGCAYGGCQAACLIFWKEAWLRRIRAERRVADSSRPTTSALQGSAGDTPICTEDDVRAATVKPDGDGEPRYVCQATELPHYTTPLSWWDVTQYLEDYTSGNATLGRLFRGFLFAAHQPLSQLPRGSHLVCRSYDRIQSLWGGLPYPGWSGTIPPGQATPTHTLNLQPGDRVRVRPYREILATLDANNKNRGLYFDRELVPYCGEVYRVRTRLETFVDETTGKLRTLKTPAILLEGVWCQSRYSSCRVFCPRSIYSWWREIWLEKLLD